MSPCQVRKCLIDVRGQCLGTRDITSRSRRQPVEEDLKSISGVNISAFLSPFPQGNLMSCLSLHRLPFDELIQVLALTLQTRFIDRSRSTMFRTPQTGSPRDQGGFIGVFVFIKDAQKRV